MLIIADSSALIALATCDSLSLLDSLFGEVRVPQAVYDEVCADGKPVAALLQAWLKDKVIKTVSRPPFLIGSGLGRGEIEAMSLYVEIKASLLLIDDSRAKKVALLNNINVTGSLGVLLAAKQNRLIPEIKPLLCQLKEASLYFSPQLFNDVLIRAGEGNN